MKTTTQQISASRPKIQYRDGRIKDRAHTLSFAVIAFFAANPDEALSTRDMMAKFGIDEPKTVAARMRRLIAENWIDKYQEADSNEWRAGLPLNVYMAGAKILAMHGIIRDD